jgi:uncharacterized protein (DUF2235 family)
MDRGFGKPKESKLSLFGQLTSWFRRHPPPVTAGVAQGRGAVDHIVILDGTLSTLAPGAETNVGLIFKLLSEVHPARRRSLYYEAGVQWESWQHLADVAQGRGINRQIRRAYGYLASHYTPGDRIFLIGYSRGAFAVRSLAGVIDQIGLLQKDHATERNVQLAYRHYQRDPERVSARAFARRFCHADTPIEMVGVFDTVKALGIRLPILWMLTEAKHAFHSHRLGRHIKHGFHALALDETRVVFEPILWVCPSDWQGNVEQVWFRGAHADVGGQVGRNKAVRGLSNIPLVWMLERMEGCGLDLPDGWRGRFICDPKAPSLGTWRGLRAVFLLRRKRVWGRDRSETLHPSVLEAGGPAYLARAAPDSPLEQAK